MDDSGDDWSLQKTYEYKSKTFQKPQQILKMVETLKKCKIKQIQFQAQFVSDYNMQKFIELYDQQQKQQENYYFHNDYEDQNNNNKMFYVDKKLKNNKDYDIKQLNFRTYQQLNIFVKIYQGRLRQLQIQHQYQLSTKKNFLQIYYPKNQLFSSFFLNQISEMKLKLQSFYCYDYRVINKIRYSQHFNNLILNYHIAAQYYKRDYKPHYTLFYSNKHQKKQIMNIINKNLLENMSIINLYDNRQCQKVNQIMFGLIIDLYDNILLQKIMKQEDLLIEKNYKFCKILIHDRYECFDKPKKQLEENLNKVVLFKLQGEYLRQISNRIFRNHQDYPFLRLKFKKKSIFCALNVQLLKSDTKYLKNFYSFMHQYFQNLSYTHKIIFYKGIIRKINKKHLSFLQQAQKLTKNTSIFLDNYQKLIRQTKQKYSILILAVKQFSQFTIQRTKKQFYQIFIKLVIQQQVKCQLEFSNQYQKGQKQQQQQQQNQNNQKRRKIKNQKTEEFQSKQLSTSFSQQSQTNFNLEFLAEISKAQQIISEEENKIKQDKPKKKKTQQNYKQKQKQKIIQPVQLKYVYSSPKQNNQLQKFWQLGDRQKGLQKILQKQYANQIKGLKYKIFRLLFKQNKLKIQPQQIDQQRFYLSTSLQKNNQISHIFISLKQVKQLKQKKLFIFYRSIQQNTQYFPSYVIQFL